MATLLSSGMEIAATFHLLDRANAMTAVTAEAIATKAGLLAAARDRLDSARQMLANSSR